MIIKNARLAPPRPTRSGNAPLLQFNIEIIPGVVIFDAVVERANSGRLFLFTPKSMWSAPTSSIAPEIRQQIISMAMDVYDDEYADKATA